MNLIPVYIVVLDYRDASVKFYTKLMSKHYSSDDVEKWLTDETSYSDSECYFMCSEEPFKITNEYR